LNNIYILPVHDCFGTHPNDMDTLADIVRVEFINLYSNQSFLQTLYNKFLFDLKSYGFEILDNEDKKYIELKKRSKVEKVILPNVPNIGTLELNEIRKSKYMIC
jgi:DNA-directed RNA polymerase